ncbi:zinc finger MYM-type protein 1-like protein [Tanacetum coccineum]|uniref:Zinc finger MYM-type protein 1-like protein n=1 Tax=Tanacetum coccineum TaxID=301880 RepID=A0ABQ5H048_9ASTR
MSTVKKKVRILDWFTPIQKKAKTQDGCFSTPQPLTDPLPEDTETRTRNDKTNDTEKEKDFNVSAIPHDPGLRINILDYNPNDQDVQMSLCLRYVNKKGAVVECFIGVVHVKGTTAVTLKKAIHSLLADHSLSPSKIRGQGYDGASNMKGEINGLKTLILKESPSAYYIHCFAHQLQLTLVAVSKKSLDCGWLFETLTNLLNVVGVSCKRNEMLKEAQAQNVAQAFDDDEYASGKGKNQELGLGRPGDTRWGSHYKLINNVISLYSIIVDVLEKIGDVSSNPDDQLKAETVSYALESFDFVFLAHLMKRLFGVANDLNYALQKKDQDIVEAMSLVELTKERRAKDKELKIGRSSKTYDFLL